MTEKGSVRRGRSACRGGRKGAKAATLAILLLAGAATLAGAGWIEDIFKRSGGTDRAAARVTETAEEVRIPLASLDPGKALFLKADLEGREIHYFALKSADGVYRAAYDACDVCFRMNRGYRQEGDLMVCNNCGQTFPSAKINEVKGGCNPAPLARAVNGPHLVIRKSDLAAGKHYFVRKRA